MGNAGLAFELRNLCGSESINICVGVGMDPLWMSKSNCTMVCNQRFSSSGRKDSFYITQYNYNASLIFHLHWFRFVLLVCTFDAGDCESVLCGGVNCIIDPWKFVSPNKATMMSPEGISKPFSRKAGGYGRGEGCGVILLKPLKKVRCLYCASYFFK